MVPVRTCIGCRERAEQDVLVRLALIITDDEHTSADSGAPGAPEVVLDVERRRSGRGAWLHPSRRCADTAVRRRAFRRAFRREVDIMGLNEAFLAWPGTRDAGTARDASVSGGDAAGTGVASDGSR